jgi:RHS repeat-associated protein
MNCRVCNDVNLNRGFTGHEHLAEFGLINMNGRMYDPILGRMLSPDNFIQDADYTQSYNRYSYCLNNPLKYTDPSGEKWNWWNLTNIFTGIPVSNSVIGGNTATGISLMPIADLFTGGMASFTAGTTAITVGAMAATFLTTQAVTYSAFNMTLHSMILPIQQTAMINDYTVGAFYDATHGGDVTSRLGNALKIDLGYLLHIPGWEDTQVLAGNGLSHIRNYTGNVDNVEIDWDQRIIMVNDVYPKDLSAEWGLTLGPYINGQNMFKDDAYYKHESGHTLQSRMFGPLYMSNIGIPSLMSATFGSSDYHNNTWYEVWANRLGEAPHLDEYPRYYRYDNFWYWFPAIVLPFFPY